MKRRKKVNGEKIFSVIITCAIILTLAIGVISVIKNSKQNTNNPENIVDLNETKENNLALNNNQTIGQKQLEPMTEDLALEEKTSAIQSTEAETTTIAEKAVESPTGASAKYSFSENDTLKWPVKGNIILKYSMESTIYFKTLGQYKTNPAVVIAAQVGDSVIAAASGVVQSVSTNEETGTTVVINIGNGYITTYGQLDNVSLKQGSTIVAGDKIGTVGQPSKYYTGEGPNVYFKLTKAGAPIDPTVYLVEE